MKKDLCGRLQKNKDLKLIINVERLKPIRYSCSVDRLELVVTLLRLFLQSFTKRRRKKVN